MLKLSIPLALLLTACAPQAAAPGAAGAGPTSLSAVAPEPSTRMQVTTTDAETALDKIVRKGMGYADFRKQLVAVGWEPVVDPQCKANVVGANFKQVCASDPTLCRVCDEMTELSSYSGDGHMLGYFRKPGGLKLRVTGYGELQYWKEGGEDPGLSVSEFEIEK